MLKHFSRLMLLCVAYISISGSGLRSMTLQESVVPPDKRMYETGLKFLETHQYIRARLAFQTLINTYPDSDLFWSGLNHTRPAPIRNFPNFKPFSWVSCYFSRCIGPA
jgi:hypothetical protein